MTESSMYQSGPGFADSSATSPSPTATARSMWAGSQSQGSPFRLDIGGGLLALMGIVAGVSGGSCYVCKGLLKCKSLGMESPEWRLLAEGAYLSDAAR